MAYFWLAIVLLLASSLTTEAKRKLNKVKRCEKIAVPQCANLGYHRTKFPNPLTNISSQEETNNRTRFLPMLAQLNCTRADVMPFLCSVYVPRCTIKRATVLPPCREFCEEAVGICPIVAASYGIEWPAPLVCSNYPSQHSSEKCIPKLKARNKSKKLGKKDKKKAKVNESLCCRIGERFAAKNETCSLSDAVKNKQKRGLNLCKDFENKFNECCKREAAKIKERYTKKQERKEKKKERKEQRKEQRQLKKKIEKQQKKQERQQKRKEKLQKQKQNRKSKKQNKKQNKKNRKNGKNE